MSNNFLIQKLIDQNYIIVSKPKMRRVERITPLSNTKCVKEEVTRSQTYQQFIRNMDHIIEILDDSESPNFDSGKFKYSVKAREYL